MTCLIRYLQTRKLFQINLDDQVDDISHQLHLANAIPSFTCNFIAGQEVVQVGGTEFFIAKMLNVLRFRVSGDKRFLKTFS